MTTKDSLIEAAMAKCSCCGEWTSADNTDSYEFEKLVRCDDCNAYSEYCGICETRHDVDCGSECRHLFWSKTLGCWAGCGADSDPEELKDSFIAMLSVIGKEAAQALRESLKAHRYHFQFAGTIFGWQKLNAYLFNPVSGEFYNWQQAFSPFFDDPDNEKVLLGADGIKWLMSLWSGDTMQQDIQTEKYDLITLGWVDEFLRGQGNE